MIKKLFPTKLKDLIKNKITVFAEQWLEKKKAKVFYCNLCNNQHSGFLPYVYYGVFSRGWEHSPEELETFNVNSYFCPICKSCDRDRLYKAFLEYEFKNIDKTKFYNFIEFAPSYFLSEWLKTLQFINYRSADLYLSGVDDTVDIQNMPVYQTNSIDYLLCSHVLEHVDDDVLATKELYRILKYGGKAIIMVPILLTIENTREDKSIKDEECRWRWYGQGDHVRLYSKTGFKSLLQSAGFEVTEITTETIYGKENFKYSYLNGLAYHSVLYLAAKNTN